MIDDSDKIAVIGLGYVGLPVALAFGRKRPVLGFDISQGRVDELASGHDRNLESSPEELKAAVQLSFTAAPQRLRDCRVFIVTVPTPINDAHQPDLTPLESASSMVGSVMPEGAIVIYESTVYPGCTQQRCVPILERESGLKHNQGFYTGYSPERINPGDKKYTLENITKVTSGSTEEVADAVDALYASIITAGTHKAASIEVAEAAKVIENAQRDLNIAFMNELAIIFHRLGLDTKEVLAAASTKWNFLGFFPGLVGGHCIGVDPYYLTYRAQQVGYHPEVILAGRRINDGMGHYVAERVVRLMLKRAIPVVKSRILVLGLTFKADCPDLRNSKVIDIIHTLQEYSVQTDIYDPWVSQEAARAEYGLDVLAEFPQNGHYDAVILAVDHAQFLQRGAKAIRALCKDSGVFYDVKGVFAKNASEERL